MILGYTVKFVLWKSLNWSEPEIISLWKLFPSTVWHSKLLQLIAELSGKEMFIQQRKYRSMRILGGLEEEENGAKHPRMQN